MSEHSKEEHCSGASAESCSGSSEAAPAAFEAVESEQGRSGYETPARDMPPEAASGGESAGNSPEQAPYCAPQCPPPYQGAFGPQYGQFAGQAPQEGYGRPQAPGQASGQAPYQAPYQGGPQAGPQTGPQAGPQYGPQGHAPGPAAPGYGWPGPGGAAHHHHPHGHCCDYGAFPGQGAGFAGGFDPLRLIGQLGAQYGQAFGPSQYGPRYDQRPGPQYGPQASPPDPGCLENQYGKVMELYSDFMQGKTDPAKIMSFLTSTGAHFWKGAAVGALLTFLLTNSAVKSALVEAVGGVFGGKDAADGEQ